MLPVNSIFSPSIAIRYAPLNPQMTLPALVLDDGTVLTQSLVILDYLDDACPGPALLQAGAERPRVRISEA
ncbi:glutathione S-transferase family protein [Bradyrhizobium sp. SZCCHNS30592]|uniref:glutathione S-transferase family protein n=1 Tax=unclassified Bradyrhizobium TaxID=2631580 RepID=UPI003966AF0A